MRSVPSLPAREPVLAGESLASLLRRTAASMGYGGPAQIRQLLSPQGKVPWNVNHLGPGPVLDHLAALLRIAPDQLLLTTTVHRLASRLAFTADGSGDAATCDSKATQRFFVPTAAICPLCLREDLVPFERLIWSLRPLGFCQEHECLLAASCGHCGRMLWPDRADVTRCRCGHDLRDISPFRLSERTCPVLSLLQELFCAPNPSLLSLSAPACVWWTQRVAAAVAKTPAWIERTRTNMSLSEEPAIHVVAWLAAAEILCHWPRRFEQFLDVFQRVTKHRTTSTGISRRFGLLLREAHDLEQLGYSVPADTLRSYLLRHYTLGHLNRKVCLFQSAQHQTLLKGRHWISHTEAARMLRLRAPAIMKLVQCGTLDGHVHLAGDCGRHLGLVSRGSVESLKRNLDNGLSISEVATSLGLGRRGVLELIHEGLLSGSVRTMRAWSVPRQPVNRLQRLFRDALAINRSDQPWISLREATRHFGPAGLKLAALLRLILKKDVSVRRLNAKRGLHGLVVHRAQLETFLPKVSLSRDQATGFPVSRAAQVLVPGRPLKPVVLQKWIAADLLQCRTEGRARLVSAEEIQRFRATYCLADEACRLLQISRTTLSRWEAQGRLQPVYGRRSHRGAGASVFRRDDVREARAK